MGTHKDGEIHENDLFAERHASGGVTILSPREVEAAEKNNQEAGHGTRSSYYTNIVLPSGWTRLNVTEITSKTE